MIGQLHFPCITWKSGGLRRDHMHGSVPDLHWGPHRARPITKRKVLRKGQARHALRYDRFQSFDIFLLRSTTDVTGSVVVVVSEYSAGLSVLFDTSRPVSLMTCLRPVLINPA